MTKTEALILMAKMEYKYLLNWMRKPERLFDMTYERQRTATQELNCIRQYVYDLQNPSPHKESWYGSPYRSPSLYGILFDDTIT